MSETPLAPEAVAVLHAAFDRALASVRGAAALHGEVAGDGAVVLEVTGDSGATITATLAPKAAERWRGTLLRLVTESRERARQQRGEHLWVCSPVDGSPGAYRVQHGGDARIFVAARPRRAWACAACRERVEPGVLLYADRRPTGWWRDVRLCESCVMGDGKGSDKR